MCPGQGAAGRWGQLQKVPGSPHCERAELSPRGPWEGLGPTPVTAQWKDCSTLVRCWLPVRGLVTCRR